MISQRIAHDLFIVSLLAFLVGCEQETDATDRPPTSRNNSGGAHSATTTSPEETGASTSSPGGSGGSGDMSSPQEPFVPPDLPNREQEGAEGGLELVGFTLQERRGRLTIYAAAENVDEVAFCEAGIQLEFFDAQDVLLTTFSGSLLSGQYFALDGASSERTPFISCLAPGDIGMFGTDQGPMGFTIEQIASIRHRFPAHPRDDVSPVDTLALGSLEQIRTIQGDALTGTVKNIAQQTTTRAKVAVFSVNDVGRPLAFALAETTTSLAPEESWTFTTGIVRELGSDTEVFLLAEYAP